MRNINAPKVGIADVIKYFWKAMHPQKWAVIFTLLAFATSSTVSVVVPFIYKNFFDLLVSGQSKAVLAPQLMQFIWLILATTISQPITSTIIQLAFTHLHQATT